MAEAASILQQQVLWFSPLRTEQSALSAGQPNEQSIPPLLHVQAVTHTYGEGPPAVRDVTLTIWAGEFLALLGKNGSGKTTLAQHLGGLLTPTHGRVLLHGQELSQVPLHLFAQSELCFSEP